MQVGEKKTANYELETVNCISSFGSEGGREVRGSGASETSSLNLRPGHENFKR
jgi:hypothetical protein